MCHLNLGNRGIKHLSGGSFGYEELGYGEGEKSHLGPNGGIDDQIHVQQLWS